MTVGERIAHFRGIRGYTTNKLANLSGISQSFLRDVELDNKGISVENLAIVCDALNISLKDFFDVPQDEIPLSQELITALGKLSLEQQIKLLDFLNSL